MKKVSVILPNYNHAPYLQARIESILQQDYSAIEVILLDDHSTDGSADIMRSYANYPQVKQLCINEHNSGNTFLQWQRGIALAEGDYIWIAESDDLARPNMLSSLVGLLDRHEQMALAYCASEWIDEKGKTIPHTIRGRWKKPFEMDGIAFCKQYLLGYNYICNASAVVMRREIARQVSEECTQYPSSGDRQFWLEMCQFGSVGYIPEALNLFRHHKNNVSAPSAKQGRNVIEDCAIYEQWREKLALTRCEQRLVCGYHHRALNQPTVSAEGRRNAQAKWSKQPYWGTWSNGLYGMSRLIHLLS